MNICSNLNHPAQIFSNLFIVPQTLEQFFDFSQIDQRKQFHPGLFEIGDTPEISGVMFPDLQERFSFLFLFNCQP